MTSALKARTKVMRAKTTVANHLVPQPKNEGRYMIFKDGVVIGQSFGLKDALRAALDEGAGVAEVLCGRPM